MSHINYGHLLWFKLGRRGKIVAHLSVSEYDFVCDGLVVTMPDIQSY